MNFLEHAWYRASPWLALLVPVSLLYCGLVRLRRGLYRTGVLDGRRLPVPVIVVGNLSVGGTGKTPLVTWLVGFLKQSGYRPGVVARGYRGGARHWPQRVCAQSDPRVVGDEPVLIARRCGCPVVVAPDRVAAARALLEHDTCDLIVCDDGLQHYRLDRDIEIAVIDGERRMGNGLCLPAGPLREPPARLREVDLVVVNGAAGGGAYPMKMGAQRAVSLCEQGPSRELAGFARQSVHAVAGIGNPERFFTGLRQAGMQLEEHVFPDHHRYTLEDLDFADGRPVLMTEKDAVKCRQLDLANAWYVPVTIEMTPLFGDRLLQRLGSGTRPAVAAVS